jgi:type IV pilus assembly protein PilM
MLKVLTRLLQEPPPAFVFEVAESGVSMARMDAVPEVQYRPLPKDTISVSPVRDNVLMADALAEAVIELTGSLTGRKNRNAAILLPDNSVRLSVLDFDKLPPDPKEQLSLIKFRLKKSVPFDIESAAVSFWPQQTAEKRVEVIAGAAPLEVVARYEAPFRLAGLQPGFVSVSALGVMHLVTSAGVVVTAKLSGRVLTVLVSVDGVLRMIRCLESQPDFDSIAADLYPTLVFTEDQMNRKADALLLCGFGTRSVQARERFAAELEIPVEVLTGPLGTPGEHNAGLFGYLQSVIKVAA